MAITSSDMSCDKVPLKSSDSAHSSKHSCRLLKLNYAPENSLTSATSKCSKPKINNSKSRSQYLTGDRIQLLSRVVEKRFVHKTNVVSSFPLAANLYKANSDDFKPSKKCTKKVKKSVLTLPNDPVPVPQECTVSDMNDSEYCDKKDEERKRKVVKKRAATQSNRKARVREKDFEFYDRDAQYCSQLNIDLDSSSTDTIKHFNGDNKRVSNRKKISPDSNKTHTASNNLSDVWTVLRNINRFRFRPSPPMSEEIIVPMNRKVQKRAKKANRKDARMIETCRTHEFAYISSYELDKKSTSNLSQSSSIDRITVIDNQDEFNIVCEEFEKRLLGTHDFLKDSNNSKKLIRKNKILCKIPKNNVRAIGDSVAKDIKQLVPLKKNKKNNLKTPFVEQRKNKMTNISSGNNGSITGTDRLQPNSDILLHTTENDMMLPAKLSFIGSDNSGSSKAGLPSKMNEQVSRYDKSVDFAVLNKERKASANIPKRLDSQQRKPRLVTTMPSSCTVPKFTQTEIKRSIAHMRFPNVVLGKDQVTSSTQVSTHDHIWPFMIESSPNAAASQIKSKLCKGNTDGICKQTVLKDKKLASNDSISLKNKATITPTPNSELIDKVIQCNKKQKSIVQLKDKMLNFLYTKSSNRDVNNDNYENHERNPITLNDIVCPVMPENKVPGVTDSQLKPGNVLVLNDPPKKGPFSTEGRNKKAPFYKYPWAKAKWASDFIDNVMKKIRSGVYYTQDRMDFCHAYQIDLQEVSVQTGLVCDTADFTQTCDSEVDFTLSETNDINQNNRICIPGFNSTQPLLEIQTLDMKQIAVKHCVTNIMVQFDVTVPAKSDKSTRDLNETLPLTPIEITESQTKVYKCQTTIFNAMLPAELCTILPKMMRSIIDSNKSSMGSPDPCLTNTDSWLSTITESTRYEGDDSKIPTSPEIKHILEGRFSNIDYIKPTFNQIDFKIKYDQCLVTETFPMVLSNNSLKYQDIALLMELDNSQYKHSQVSFPQSEMLQMVSSNNLLKYQEIALIMELDNSQYKHSQVSLHQSNEQICGAQNHTICKSVQIYTGTKNKLTSPIEPNHFVGMIESIKRSHNLQINQNLSSYFDMLKLQYDGKNVEIKMSMTNSSGVHKSISVTINNLNIDSINKAFPKIKNDNKYQINRNNSPLKCIEYINDTVAIKSRNAEMTQINLKKNKRKGFLGLYRKCKSKSNVPSGAKWTNTANTPLDKITTLDDFFQILGSKKIFSSVFDGNAAKKILSSVMEMKNWISEINPKQALLVLLLTNKKDTQNLVRFRPIILQAIAVNRITRASELDMEIEVIDRENLKTFPQFEGITYLPESTTDYENLLDELYWIAKTTESCSSSDDSDSESDLPVRKRKKIHLRIDRFLKWDENDFLDRFRISKTLARALASKLRPLLKTRTMKNNAITPEQQILMALEFYACGSFQRCIGDAAGVHKSSVCRVIHRVSRAIAGLRSEWVVMLSRPDLDKEAKLFYEISAFPKTIGAIDCTHIPIKSPGGMDTEIYRNRKQIFSINVQVICNAQMYINNIVARWPGSCHHSHIFNSSVIKGRLEDGEFEGFWLLGDKGYAVKPYLLTPLRNATTEAKRLYNESQIRSRNVVERTFGCWKKRFPSSSSSKLRTNPRRAQAAVVAMAVLHNICKKSRDPMPFPRQRHDDEGSSDEEELFSSPPATSNNDEHNRNMLIHNYFSRLTRG